MSRSTDSSVVVAARRRPVRARICVISRLPEPGVSKTRLIPVLGESGAADVQRAMTEHVVRECRIAAGLPLAPRPTRTVVDIEARITGGSSSEGAAWLGVRAVDQGSGDLGARLGRALRDGAERHDVVAVVGADCPSVTGADLNQLLSDALHAGAAIIPAEDGGYCALALSARGLHAIPLIMRDVPWGGADVCAATIERLRCVGIEPVLLPTRFDVDIAADLPRWEQLREAWEAPPTTVSVIIPVLDEAGLIGDVVRNVLLEPGVECVVVDGGSTDATVESARAAGAHKVLVSASGRAKQMNAGARSASGEVLLFLHADTSLPPSWSSAALTTVRHVTDATDGLGLGAFTFALDDPRFAYRIIEAFTRMRGRLLSLPYGDQAVFMRKSLFESMGGFPEYPVMEDYEFVDRARRVGDVHIIRMHAVTSARAWRSQGVCSRAMLNMRTIARYRRGYSPERLAQWRARDACDGQSKR